MSSEDDRWQVQWVREYRQFVIYPPVGWGGEDPADDSFDTLKEAFEWIDKAMMSAPVEDSIVQSVPQPEQRPDPVVLPPRYKSKTDEVEEPVRQYGPGEHINRVRIVNPIAEQDMTESKRDRLAGYSDMVGLQ